MIMLTTCNDDDDVIDCIIQNRQELIKSVTMISRELKRDHDVVSVLNDWILHHPLNWQHQDGHIMQDGHIKMDISIDFR